MPDSIGTTDFVLEGSMVVREKKDGDYKATYLTGPRGMEYGKDDANGEVRWYLYDGLGSVIGEVDNTGTITSTHQNDVYGNTLSSSGTSTTNHKFVGRLGHRTEASTGNLTYMGARYYDPVLGRFISEDSAGDGNNWYVYCRNNPINIIDPDGKSAETYLELFAGGFLFGVFGSIGAELALGYYPTPEKLAKMMAGSFMAAGVGTLYKLLQNLCASKAAEGFGGSAIRSVRWAYGATEKVVSGLALGQSVGWAMSIIMGERSGEIGYWLYEGDNPRR
jgi:RHS repeat-associated protein